MSSIDIFLERMAYFVYVEKKPFCYKDFLSFEHDSEDYRFAYGTIRNIFSKLRKKERIELKYNSGVAFHTLKGVDVGGKSITPNHGEDYLSPKQKGFYQFLSNLPTDKLPGIHDIRLRFQLKNLWSILSSSSSNSIKNKDEKSNKDITLKDIIHDNDCKIKTTIHHTNKIHNTNTVSIVIGCTSNPIPIDYDGILKLTTGLARVEERLQTIIDEYSNNKKYQIPPHMSWITTMWHFNQDSLTEYGGERFEMNWKDILGAFRIYSKKTTKK